MAPILDILLADISLKELVIWLTNDDQSDKEFAHVLKEKAELKKLFPSLLIEFVKDHTARILKANLVCPQGHVQPSPKKTFSTISEILPSPVDLKNFETRNIRRTRAGPTYNLQNDLAFPPLQQTSREIQRKRRINPTQLSPASDGGIAQSKFQFGLSLHAAQTFSITNAFNQAKEQISSKNLDQERALLRERKKKPTSPIATKARRAEVSDSCVMICAYTEPEIGLVTCIALLDRLSAMYSFCLSKNLVPHLYSEVEFLLQLALLRVSPVHYQPMEGCLSSVHNCVYFAVKSLEGLNDVWDHVDHATLRLLTENSRVCKFSPDFISKITKKISSRRDCAERWPTYYHRRTTSNVAFQSETDNRLNFASDSSFHVFRKQRDQFCEVWQIWKQNHSNAEWNMSASLKRLIQSLVDIKHDCVNYFHLARLFRSQLLTVACLLDDRPVNIQQANPGSGTPSGPLDLLQNCDPHKLRRLRDRLVNSTEGRGNNSGGVKKVDYLTEFEGDQQFFRDFIVLASSSAFNEHLKNSFISGIDELNEQSLLTIGDRGDTSQNHGKFCETVISLRVLGKFLALITFDAYKSTDHLPEHIFYQLSQLKSKEGPPVDLLRYVEKAYWHGRLVLTLPWVVTYLALADPISMSLSNYRSVACYLIMIFRRVSAIHLPAANGFFIRILLSWMFQQVHFPRALLSKTDNQLLSEIPEHPFDSTRGKEGHEPLSLDNLYHVDSTLLYQCCPFMSVWKSMLVDFALDVKWGERALPSRKITPISAEDHRLQQDVHNTDSATAGGKLLQLALEESFFHNQPSSVKKTVDFVSDRLASNVIRDVRHQVIPGLVERGQGVIHQWQPAETLNLEDKFESLSGELCRDARQQEQLLTSSILTSLKRILDVLLPNDVLQRVSELCVEITARLARQKVAAWMDRHVTLSLFQNELSAEWNKMEKSGVRSTTADELSLMICRVSINGHDTSTLPPSVLINRIKKFIVDTVRDVTKLTRSDLMDTVTYLHNSFERRFDVTPVSFKCLIQLTFEWILITCIFQPEIIELDILQRWVNFWKRFHPVDECLDPCEIRIETESHSSLVHSSMWLIFAPKHLLLLAQSTSPRVSWSHLTYLLLQLLKSRLLHYKSVEEQAVAVIRQNWPQELLHRFATCLRDVVEWQRSQLETDGDVLENGQIDDGLLSWLSWFCSHSDL